MDAFMVMSSVKQIKYTNFLQGRNYQNSLSNFMTQGVMFILKTVGSPPPHKESQAHSSFIADSLQHLRKKFK